MSCLKGLWKNLEKYTICRNWSAKAIQETHNGVQSLKTSKFSALYRADKDSILNEKPLEIAS